MFYSDISAPEIGFFFYIFNSFAIINRVFATHFGIVRWRKSSDCRIVSMELEIQIQILVMNIHAN
jgi:hypothetical protein